MNPKIGDMVTVKKYQEKGAFFHNAYRDKVGLIKDIRNVPKIAYIEWMDNGTVTQWVPFEAIEVLSP